MLPNHIGIIMDGNRRWAKAHNQSLSEGHLHGYKVLSKLSRYALLEKGIPYVSAFVFSTENWARAKEEISFLMGLVTRGLKEYLEDFHRNNIKILILGSREKLGKDIIKALEYAEQRTKNNIGGTLALCFNYGGQTEIVDAVKKISKAGVDIDNLNPEVFEKYLYKPELPPVDIIVRTSGEQRTSGFMLWQAAYAELMFINKHWPDFTTKDIDEVLAEFANRQRRFGK